MRRHLGTAFALISVDDVWRVDRQAAVRVDDDAEKTGVRLPHSENNSQHFRVMLQ